MHFIWIILIGFVVGLVAKFLTPGREPGGFIFTSILGIAGALLASFLGQSIGWYAPNQPAGFLASVVGAVLLLLVYNFIKRRSA